MAFISDDALLCGFNSTDSTYRELKNEAANRSAPPPAAELYLPPMHQKRLFHAAVKVDMHRILIIGGSDGDALGSTDLYDSRKKEWKQFPDLNHKRSGHAAAICNGKVYVFGGRGGYSSRLDTIECLDLTSKPLRWETMNAHLTSARSGCVAATVGKLIYIMGGRSDDSIALSSVNILCTTTGRIWEGPPMTKSRWGCSAGAVDNTVFAVGGIDANGNGLRTIESLTVEKNKLSQWQRCVMALSTERFFPASAVVGNCLVIMGGRDNEENILSSAEVLDTKLGARSILPGMKKARYGCAAATLGETQVTVVGGSGGGVTHNSMEELDPQVAILNDDEEEQDDSLRDMKERLMSLELLVHELTERVAQAESNRETEFRAMKALVKEMSDRFTEAENNRSDEVLAVVNKLQKRKKWVIAEEQDDERAEQDTGRYF